MSNNILHWYCKSRNYEISNGLHIELRYLATAACRLGCKAAKVLLGPIFWLDAKPSGSRVAQDAAGVRGGQTIEVLRDRA